MIRPSKRLLGMAFRHAAHIFNADARHPTPDTRHQPADLNAVAAALEIRHGTILLHDDIVDGDTVRDGHPIAHHALPAAFGTQEAPSAALFAGNILAARPRRTAMLGLMSTREARPRGDLGAFSGSR
ncbi:polyprenyl synthetase family protein [Streptomyces sp. NPDC056638]|uniref:polyprenyl synthetase family protein n=1 Tax=Streptomyces sp. NPDC056638 TaxID=3345887 RepID=UPI0036CDECF6